MDTLYTQQLSKLEKTHEILLDCEEIKPVNPKGNQSRVFIGRTDAEAKAPSNTLATWCEKLTHWKRPWSWARLKAGGEGDDRGWYGWMASPTRWMWAWASSRRWWWTGKPGVLQVHGAAKSQTWLSDWTRNKGQTKVLLPYFWIKLAEPNWPALTN